MQLPRKAHGGWVSSSSLGKRPIAGISGAPSGKPDDESIYRPTSHPYSKGLAWLGQPTLFGVLQQPKPGSGSTDANIGSQQAQPVLSLSQRTKELQKQVLRSGFVFAAERSSSAPAVPPAVAKLRLSQTAAATAATARGAATSAAPQPQQQARPRTEEPEVLKRLAAQVRARQLLMPRGDLTAAPELTYTPAGEGGPTLPLSLPSRPRPPTDSWSRPGRRAVGFAVASGAETGLLPPSVRHHRLTACSERLYSERDGHDGHGRGRMHLGNVCTCGCGKFTCAYGHTMYPGQKQQKDYDDDYYTDEEDDYCSLCEQYREDYLLPEEEEEGSDGLDEEEEEDYEEEDDWEEEDLEDEEESDPAAVMPPPPAPPAPPTLLRTPQQLLHRHHFHPHHGNSSGTDPRTMFTSSSSSRSASVSARTVDPSSASSAPTPTPADLPCSAHSTPRLGLFSPPPADAPVAPASAPAADADGSAALALPQATAAASEAQAPEAGSAGEQQQGDAAARRARRRFHYNLPLL